MPKLFALHTIHRNPTGKKIEVVEPESVFSASDAEAKDLTKLNAVREASAEDVAVAKAKGKFADDADDAADEGDGEAEDEGESNEGRKPAARSRSRKSAEV